MKNLSIKTSLLLMVGFLLCIVLLSVSGTLLRVKGANAQLENLYSARVVPMMELKKVGDAYAIRVVGATQKARDGAITPEEALKLVQQSRAEIQKEWQAFKAASGPAQDPALVAAVEKAMQQADAVIQKLVPILEKGDVSALFGFAAMELYPSVDPVESALQALEEAQVQAVAQAYETSQAEYPAILARNIGVAAFSVLVALALSVYLIRLITGGLSQALQLAQRVANGDLTATVPTQGRNEISALMQALHQMNDGLAAIVRQVREGAHAIASGSAQIAHGNADLSQRTETQASNLEETASSMEELTANVRQSAETARTTAQLASTAAQQAVQGGRVVGEVVHTMEQISASSRRIADIIGVIDGIAFQTNILALNAAVEAARAGEQGRGFAVVASEVRSLAGRSAEAAKEIKSLIDASASTVEEGNRLVAQAGTAMQSIVQQVEQVSLLMAESSASSSQQTTGIEQVAQAVSQLDQVTQQNAALVEESAAAAEGLRIQADRLSAVVGRFQLPQVTLSHSTTL